MEDIEQFIKKQKKYSSTYMQGKGDEEKVKEFYMKWRKLKSVIGADVVKGGIEEIDKLDDIMKKTVEELFEKRTARSTIVENLDRFVRTFKKNILLEHRVIGAPTSINWDEPISHFNAYVITKEFEEKVRNFIKSQLKKEFGDNWIKQGVPKGQREGWREKEEKDQEFGRDPDEKIDYSSFSDYFEIIKFNWKNVFQDIFEDKDKTRVRFNDIRRVMRNPTMHVRELDPNEVGHAKFTKKWIENKMEKVS